jgi:hypothetical protein
MNDIKHASNDRVEQIAEDARKMAAADVGHAPVPVPWEKQHARNTAAEATAEQRRREA